MKEVDSSKDPECVNESNAKINWDEMKKNMDEVKDENEGPIEPKLETEDRKRPKFEMEKANAETPNTLKNLLTD